MINTNRLVLKKAPMMKRNNELHDTNERIMKAALELFVRKGFHGTSISSIMEKVDMTKGAFYSHFDSKNNLFLKLIDEFRVRFFEEMVKKIDGFEGDALEKIHHTISFISRFGEEHTDLCVFLTFLSPELSADEEFEAPLRGIYRDYQKFISQLIKQGVREGVFKKELNPDLAALAFMALHDGALNQWWRLNRQWVDGEEYVRTFRNIILSGLVLSMP